LYNIFRVIHLRNYQKPIKYYLLLLLLSFLIIGGFGFYQYLQGDLVIGDIWALILMPIVFVGLYYGSDVAVRKIQEKRKKKDYEGNFLEAVGLRLRLTNQFLIEDFRKLQTSEKFQESMKIAFKISREGESELFTLEKLERKFDKRTVEYKAIVEVISYLKELRDTANVTPESK